MTADGLGPADDVVSEGGECAEKGDSGDELLVEGVDAGDGVVEFTLRVADEGHGGDAAELTARPFVDDDGALPVCWRGVSYVTFVMNSNTRSQSLPWGYSLVAVVDERGAVDELAPLLLLGCVGDQRVE